MANVLVWYRKHAFVYTHIYSNLKTILTLGEEEEASLRTNQSMPARCGCDFVSWITKDIIFIIIILVFCKTILSCQRYTIADFKICQYLRLHMKIICWRFHIKIRFTYWVVRTWDMWKVCLQTFKNIRIC